MENNLCDILEKYRKINDDLYFEKFLESFSPLIDKYSNKIEFNFKKDFKQELTLELYIVLKKIIKNNIIFSNDKCLVRYISLSIKRRYYYLFNNYKKDMLSIENIDFIQSHYLDNNNILFYDILKNLNLLEQTVLIFYFKDNLSINDIANKLNYSRQYINKIKLRALNKLEKIYKFKKEF